MKNLFSIYFDNWQITIYINTIFVIIILFLIGLTWVIIKNSKKKLTSKLFKHKVKFKIKTPNFDLEEELNVSYDSIFIAHRIYIELITRKAAIPIDEKYDIIIEIYDSLYKLFKQIRNEIKDLPGEIVNGNKSCSDLIQITTKILNEGLRPHLTKYQAGFRKWYIERLEVEKNKNFEERNSPQIIQREYFDYENLIKDLKNVNSVLLIFSEQLKNLIKSNEND